MPVLQFHHKSIQVNLKHYEATNQLYTLTRGTRYSVRPYGKLATRIGVVEEPQFQLNSNICNGGIAQWQSIRLQIERSPVQLRLPPVKFCVTNISFDVKIKLAAWDIGWFC